MRVCMVFMLALLTIPRWLQAAEPTVAPSAKEIVMGRVFTTNAERRVLDQLRKIPQTGTAAGAATSGDAAQSGPKQKPDPAGFIVPSTGRAYQWIDGDFRRISRGEISSGQIPGTVRIIRHRSPAGERNSQKAIDDHGGALPTEPGVADPESGDDERD